VLVVNQGAIGLQGSTGAIGLQGSTGAQGASGEQGAIGLQGLVVIKELVGFTRFYWSTGLLVVNKELQGLQVFNKEQ
jgi:hypothetical protein